MTLPAIQQRSVEELIDRNIQHHHRGLDEIVERFRNSVIVRALALNHGNLERTADVLGIEYTELKGWMTRYGIKA